jgi:hypothetical protein
MDSTRAIDPPRRIESHITTYTSHDSSMSPPSWATVPKKIIAIARRSPSTRVTRARAKDDRANENHGNEPSIMGVNDHDTFSGLAPLHVAAKDGDLKKLVEIMDDGADVNIRACGEVRVGRTNEGVTIARGVSMLDGTMGDAREGAAKE